MGILSLQDRRLESSPRRRAELTVSDLFSPLPRSSNEVKSWLTRKEWIVRQEHAQTLSKPPSDTLYCAIFRGSRSSLWSKLTVLPYTCLPFVFIA